MRRTVAFVTIVILISILFTSCGTLLTKGGSDYRSGVAAYEKQEYVSSLRYLTAALSVNPEFEEAAQLYPVVFNEGSTYYKNRIAENRGKENRESADRVYYAYSRLQDLHEIARSSGQKGLAIEDFSEELEESRLISGNLWFDYGQALHEKGDRESLKQAVAAYETARGRNANIQGLDALIADAMERATVTLAVAAFGSGVTNFSQMVLDDVNMIFSGDRFVKVIQKHDFIGGEGSMVGPTDIAIMTAMKEGWDYVLEVYAHQSFEQITKEDQIRLPYDLPLFSGIGKTMGYQHETTISYRLFDIEEGVSIILENSVREIDGPYEYTFSYVGAEGLRELNLGGTGKKNLRYVTSKTDDITTNSAINSLRWDYESIPIPVEITDPTDQTQWISYFNDMYDDFRTFAENESGRQLFYATEVVHHTPSDTYFMVGPSLDEAIRRSKINSAIMNALSYTGRTLIEQAKDRGGIGYRKAGKLAGNAIKDLL